MTSHISTQLNSRQELLNMGQSLLELEQATMPGETMKEVFLTLMNASQT
jgi:hypothetical protein